MVEQEKPTIAVLGLGYVGLPLAIEFAKKYDVIGYDINTERISELRAGFDRTLEVEPEMLARSTRLQYTDAAAGIAPADIFIVTAPTPINENKQPDLNPVLGAAETVAKVLEPGDTVIFESTVYPGATEEECVPVLERVSGLEFNKDFTVGYSPERINPGDKERRVDTIIKVTSGSTEAAADFIDDLYASIITAGTHKAPSIKVAEAAKVIENTQRDVNIALMNELAVLFDRLGIDTHEVLAAAGTKWNFLKFTPGLVGGHCIGVDPYYLTHKAQAVGHHPEIILAGRRLNDHMSDFVASKLVKTMLQRGMTVADARVLVLGLTFKENTPDLRNTKVVDVVRELQEYGITVDVHDPLADRAEAVDYLGLEPIESPTPGEYDAVVLAVPHAAYGGLFPTIRDLLRDPDSGIVYDLKAVLSRGTSDLRL